jgi:ATP-binding cassette subfamily B protein/ATP-binding cassette subfamily C protein
VRERLQGLATLARYLPRTYRLVWDSSRGFAVLLVVLLLGSSALPAAMAWVAKLVVDAVVDSAKSHDPAQQHHVLMLVGLELGLMLVQLTVNRLQSLLRSLMGETLGNHVNVMILEKALTLELRHFEDADFYDKMQNARREASSRPLNLVLGLVELLHQGIVLASYTFLLTRLSWWSALIIVGASLPAFIAEARMSRDAFRLNSWRAPEGRRANYLEWILTRDAHVKEVKIYGIGQLVLDRYKALFTRFYAEDRALAVRRTVYGLVLGGLSLLAFYASYAWMAGKASLAAISLGDLTLYLTVFRQGQGALQGALSGVAGLYEDGLYMSNLFTYLDMPTSGEAPRALPPQAAPQGPQTIEFRDVSFRYPKSEKWVLRHVNLTVAPGEKLALVGENGAGKSTLIKLLMRLYNPTEGAVLYGGVDLRDMDPWELRQRLGVVFQDFVRYQFNVSENIGLGWVPKMNDQLRIAEAAERGGAKAVIEGLPQKYETMLGGWFEEGQELSGGQWQKIAIARAFMRDAEVLILDEPTAALDAEAEHDLFVRLQALAAHRSAILISHRFSTVRRADRIAVIRDGQVEELGTHADLLEKNGRYAQLFKLQAAGYVD